MSLTRTYEDGLRLANQLIENERAACDCFDDDALATVINQLEEALKLNENIPIMTYEQAVQKIQAYIRWKHLGDSKGMDTLPADMAQALKMIERGY